MTDSPTRKKRFGAGICWEYMDKGSCPCEAGSFPAWHPRLSVAAAATTPSPSGATCTVASMPKRIPEWIESLKYLGFVEGDPENFAILNTTYEEREEAKVLGASWAPGMKRWIVVQGQDLSPFAKFSPRINNRGVGEVVLHNPYIDMASAVKELQKCGIHPSQFVVRGDGDEADMVRGEISAMHQHGDRAARHDNGRGRSDVIDLCAATPHKRRLDYGPGSASTTGGNAGSSKSPRFSTPASMQTFVRQKQDEQAMGAAQVSGKVSGATAIEGSRQRGSRQRGELSELLSTAKSALVRCNTAGGISREQKQFNEAIYNVVETLAARFNGSENRGVVNHHEPVSNWRSSRMNPKRTMVTPTQAIVGSGGKAPAESLGMT